MVRKRGWALGGFIRWIDRERGSAGKRQGRRAQEADVSMEREVGRKERVGGRGRPWETSDMFEYIYLSICHR